MADSYTISLTGGHETNAGRLFVSNKHAQLPHHHAVSYRGRGLQAEAKGNAESTAL